MTDIIDGDAKTESGCTASDYVGTYAGERGEPFPFETFDRLTYRVDPGDHETPEIRRLAPLEEADVISSEIDADRHAPCIDIDVPARFIPSSSPGHGHLYFDVEMTWEQYLAILTALADAGVVEQGYLNASTLRKGTHLRLPWVRKPADPFDTITKESK